jgi:hypothetical protein
MGLLGVKVKDCGPLRVQLPVSGGLRDGGGELAASGAEKLTVMVEA